MAATEQVAAATSGADNLSEEDLPPPEPQLTIWQLCQRGDIDAVSALVDTGADVRERDSENISCLHWAAINNRSQLCEFLISKGSEVDALGGELVATPLQWAVRYGHLETTILLVRHGADPTIQDTQGFNSLHLAAQFGYPNVVAYLVARGVDVDVTDAEGHTALMWVAMKIFDADCARVLISLKAAVNYQDNHKNTALNLAVINSNVNVAQLLILAGANPCVKNDQGKSAQDLAYDKQMQITRPRMMQGIIPPPNVDKQCVAVLQREPTRRIILCLMPFLVLVGIGLAAEMVKVDFIKGCVFLAAVLAFAMTLYGMAAENPEVNYAWPGPMAVYLGTKFMMFGAFFFILWPYAYGPGALVGLQWQLCAFGASFGLFYYWYKAHSTPPGFIPKSMKESCNVIIELAESNRLSSKEYCYTCAIRKPYRSKHCGLCGKCVSKFDHHCPFVDNCVGQNNHRYFILFLMFLPALIFTYDILAYRYLKQECPVHKTGIGTVLGWVFCSPFIAWTVANGAMHCCWVIGLYIMQMKQIAQDFTTNEEINKWRYEYLNNGAPWSKGAFKNIINFFNPSNRADWSKVFELPKTKY